MDELWYTRLVLCGSDLKRAPDFYENQLGFRQDWDYHQEGQRLIAQVSQQGFELILSSQWSERKAVLDTVRTQLELSGLPVKDGEWGDRPWWSRIRRAARSIFPYPGEELQGGEAL